MLFYKKVYNLKSTVPATEAAAGDYIKIYWDNGTGTIDYTQALARVAGVSSGSNFVFNHPFIASTPNTYKFVFKYYDKYGNLGATSSEQTLDATDLEPYIKNYLKYVDYTNSTLTLEL
jgi:hypothetical protein